MEESRTDRGSVTKKPASNEESSKTVQSSDDENEIDLRERLLREKAIKSMKRRQVISNSKPTTDRIVYETQ